METVQKMSEKSNIINMEKSSLEKIGNEKNQKHLKRCRYYNNMETVQKMSQKSNIINMEKSSLEKMSKSELIDLLLEQISNKRPIPAPRKSVKSMVQQYEGNISSSPTYLKPIPAPRTQKSLDAYIPSKLSQSIPQKRPIPAPRKSVKSMVQQYEGNISSSPTYLKPIPAPRTQKSLDAYIPSKLSQSIPQKRTIVAQMQQALEGYTKSFNIELKDNKDPLVQLQESRKAIEYLFNNQLKIFKGFKYVETLQVKFIKFSNGEKTEKNVFFNSKVDLILNNTNIQASLQISKQHILNIISQWVSEGSGWTVESIESHHLNIANYSPLKGSSYIELPPEIKNPKSLINIKNEDNECFRWCHIRHLNPQNKNPQRINKIDKNLIKQLDYSNIEFPVTVKQINKIEKQNNIRINLFGYEEKQKFPLYISQEKYHEHMELLLINKDKKNHYVLIKNFNKFMFDQTKHKCKKYFCMYCLQCFSRKDVLDEHVKNCISINGKQAIKMPEKGQHVNFRNYHKQIPAPFVIYADFEAITKKVHGCLPNNEKSYTEAYQKHIDCGYGYKLVCHYNDEFSKPVQVFRDENAVYNFMEKMLEEVEWCKSIIKKHFNKPLIMTEENKLDFESANYCHICKNRYSEEDIRVRDHCHITGNYRGSAHQDCNLKLRISPTNIQIPVFFHNLRGYDSHFIMQQIGEIAKKHVYKNKKGEECQMDINCIPNNMEKYMAFMLGKHLLFLDSFQFMSSSLDNLTKNLPDDAFIFTQQEFTGEQYNLMKQKGTYPYDYMDSFQKFNDTQLPIKKDFFSILYNQHITHKQYNHAQTVWNTFGLKTMGDYHDLYLKSDTLLLADIFENFRKTCLQYYKLDPCHYFSSPGLSWDAMLKMTKIKLELVTDIDMYQFIEKGLRGGTSYIANRFSEANNKYMENFDENLPSKYIMYLDANNLYGWAMSQYLPTGNFKWLTKKQIEQTNLARYSEEQDEGLLLEVDLDYPQELHDLHNDYPLAPEKLKVNKNMLSEYCQKIAGKFNISSGQVHKLITTLGKKEKYVLHYRNLQLYLSLGLKLKKVHRVLQFNQSPWLKKYIDFNTNKRTLSKNDFEKNFFKLMNNSVFGKTMENLRKRVDVRLVTDKEKLLKLSSKPSYVSSKIFNENLVAVHKIKETLLMNRPAFVGACILDLSKTFMYDFHYNYIKCKYGDKAKLLFTDTDSLTYEIETPDAYADFLQNKDIFDNSDYNKKSPFYFDHNKKVIGKFKDEAAGIPVTEFVGLRSKMYSYTLDNKQSKRTAKGIKKNIIQNNLSHGNYKKVLLSEEQIHHSMKTIRSMKHQLASYELNKISLSCFDDKRYIHKNGITSYAYGHYKILKV